VNGGWRRDAIFVLALGMLPGQTQTTSVSGVVTDHTDGVIPGTTGVVTNAVRQSEGGAALRRDHLQNSVAIQNGRGRGNRPTLICVVVVGRRVHACMDPLDFGKV
jgi:hypothetical protein